jgi:hypothetical protein
MPGQMLGDLRGISKSKQDEVHGELLPVSAIYEVV